MSSLRLLALLTALSATAHCYGSLKVVNNCDFDITAQSVDGIRNSGSPYTVTAGGGASQTLEHSTDGKKIRLYKDDDSSGWLVSETALERTEFVKYDIYKDNGSPVGDSFKVILSDGSCHTIQGGQGNFDPVNLDLYTCSVDSSLTVTLC